MRAIKFRQKLKPEYVKNSDEFHYWGNIDKGFTSPVGKNYCDCDSEQFTGLQDVNGIDIYEGDILLVTSGVTSEIVSVIYFMGNACFRFGLSETGTALFPTLTTMIKEIIGNIHENSELLK